jgi:hypothetical protein
VFHVRSLYQKQTSDHKHGRNDKAAVHSATISGKVAVVIVDHGSRKVEANQALQEFANLFQNHSGVAIVEIAHMELAEPTIEQAIGQWTSLRYLPVICT